MKYIAVPANQISQQALCKIMPRPFGPEDYITFFGNPKPPSKTKVPKPPPSKPKVSNPPSKTKVSNPPPSKPTASKQVRARVNVQKKPDGSQIVTVKKN
jgi:hypothetical protein